MFSVGVTVGAGARDAAAATDVVVLVDESVRQYRRTAAQLTESLGGRATIVDIDDSADPVDEARRHAPRVVVAIGKQALQLVAGRVKDTPIVYCTVLYPDRYERLGDNITGVPLEIPMATQLERFARVVPGAKRIGVLYTAAGSGFLVDAAREAARGLDVRIVARAVKKRREVAGALTELLPQIDALLLVPDSEVVTKDVFAYLLGETMDAGIPVLGFLEGFTQAGALAAISADYDEIGQLGARLVRQVLRAEPGAPLPPPVYSRGALSINLKTAQRLRIEIRREVQKLAQRLY